MTNPRDKKVVEDIRQEILREALNIIVSEGFNSFTMRRLAKAVNMTAPNLYNYYSNKDEIYLNIMIRGYDKLYSILQKAIYDKDIKDPLERIKIISTNYIDFGLSNPEYYEIMFVSTTPKHLDYIGTRSEGLSEIEYKAAMDLFELAMQSTTALYEDKVKTENNGEVLSSKVEIKVLQLWSMLHGMVCLSNFGVMPYIVEEHQDTYSLIIEDALNSLFSDITSC